MGTIIIAQVSQQESVLSLSTSTTSSQLLAAMANMSYDVIELADGTFSMLTFPIYVDIDRTARPLTIRPAAGATPVFYGQTRPIYFGLNSGGSKPKTCYITVEGITFEGCDYSTTQDGIIWTGYVDHVAFNDITVQNLGPYYAPAPRCWVMYISSDLSHSGSNITANNWTVDGNYGGARGWGGLAQGHSPAASNVTANGWTIQNCKYAIYAHGESDSTAVNCNFDDWAIDDCGYNDGVPCSVVFGYMSGTYSNLTATNCTGYPLYKYGSPQPTDGGGNSGL